MQATEPNIPAIVEQIAEQFQGQPRDRFARIMQEIAQRLEVEAMEANGVGPDHELAEMTDEEIRAANFGRDPLTYHTYGCDCNHCQRILGKMLSTVEA